jgi:hypothetical protein
LAASAVDLVILASTHSVGHVTRGALATSASRWRVCEPEGEFRV